MFVYLVKRKRCTTGKVADIPVSGKEYMKITIYLEITAELNQIYWILNLSRNNSAKRALFSRIEDVY